MMEGSCGYVGFLIKVNRLNILPYIVLSSNYWVDLNELYMFVKSSYEDTDKKEIPKRTNIKNEVLKFEFPSREFQDRTYFALGAVVKYFFQHSRDFAVCRQIVDEILQSLVSDRGTKQKETKVHQSLFELYTQISRSSEIDCLVPDYTFILNEQRIPYLQLDYKTCFNDTEWNRIKLFEFNFGLQEDESQDDNLALKNRLSRKWTYWVDCVSSLKIGQAANRMNINTCSYQKKRILTAAAIEGITIPIAGKTHLPEHIEAELSKVLREFNVDYFETIIAVGCNESCPHKDGAHIFIEMSIEKEPLDLNNISTILIGSLKDHILIQGVVFLSKGTVTSFQETEQVPRFLLRDAFLTKKLSDSIVFIHNNQDEEDYFEEAEENNEAIPCEICFLEHKKWLLDPLTMPTFDRIKEWQLYVPFPVRLYLQKAFVSDASFKRSQDQASLAASKITRLLTTYEASLNTLSKAYFGVTQEVNTAELVVSYHNVTSVFNVTQSAGITRSLNSAESRLKNLASPERCYFKTYIAKHPLIYEATNDRGPIQHFISLRECHLVFLVDNLVRLRTKGDPGPGITPTTQVCTLPITVKGLPRNAKLSIDWHGENCDGTIVCECKDGKDLTKDEVDACFLSQTEAMEKVREEFETEAVWGLKILFNNSKIRQMLETAAQCNLLEKQDELIDSTLNVSFMNLSLQEIQPGSQTPDHEKSFQGLPFEDVTFPTSEILTGKSDTPTAQMTELPVMMLHKGEELTACSSIQLPRIHVQSIPEYADEEFYDDEEENEEEEDKGMPLEVQERNDDSRHDSFEEQEYDSNSENEVTISILNPSEDNEHESETDVFETEDNIVIPYTQYTNKSEQPSTRTESFISSVSSFVKFEAPILLCRHPPPAIGKDDDKSKLREILDDLLIKSGHFIYPGNKKEKILTATDHKVASNVFELIKLPRYKTFLPEFPVLHLMKSKVTNLISAYTPAGIIQLLKYMKDAEDETDWKKIVSISEIETAVKTIRRLAIALHLAFFIRFLESMDPIEADNILIDMETGSNIETNNRWNPAYIAFINEGCANNATFCLHFEIMQHCDEIVAVQLAEKTGGKQGYTLLLSVVKSSLHFAFLNGASSYASFCVKLMNEHYTAGQFYQRMKETLFSTPHKDTKSNFALDAQREMDHRDVVRGFRPSSGIKAVIPRMSVIDDLCTMRRALHTSKTTNSSQLMEPQDRSLTPYLGKAITQKDLMFVTRGTELLLRINALSTKIDETPKCIYEKTPRPLTDSILDSKTFQLGRYLVFRYICTSKIGGTNEDDCPNLDSVDGPSDLRKKIKSGKAVTVNRNKCKISNQKSETQIVEERRKKDINRINKFSLHVTSTMNTCQAIVKPDCSKADTSKASGIKDALLFALCQTNDSEISKGKTKTVIQTQRSTDLQQTGLAFLKAKQYPVTSISTGKVLIAEFAGVKFKAFSQSGKQYLEYIETLIYSMLEEFPGVKHIVICEEKYSFTPDAFKAMTHAKREKVDKLDVFHLKSDSEMLSLESYSKSALTRTKEGKILSSRFLGEHVHELQIEKDLILDIDSEYLISAGLCKSSQSHQENPCKQYTTPVRAIFSKESGFVSSSQLTSIRQRKGEAELAQADWLPYIAQELEEDESVICYVTSGDIDTLPIHMLAVALYWPRFPNQTFKNDVYLILKKPGKHTKPDIYVVTKIVERLEQLYRCKDISVIVSISLCIGGNDFLPKFYGISHTDWMEAILNEPVTSNLYRILRHSVTNKIIDIELNEDVYLSIVKKLYCPRGLNVDSLSIEDVRQISIKYPGKSIRNPQQWMPPVTALKKVICLVNSHIKYLLTVCKPESDLPDFLSNGGIRQSNEGVIVYDLGPDVRYTNESEILSIEEGQLKEKITAARCVRSRKRNMSITPSKDEKKSRRKLYTSTPR